MSLTDYDEARLHRENTAEEMARDIHAAYARLAPGYAHIPCTGDSWDDIPPNLKALLIQMSKDLVDQRNVVPWSVVRSLQIELTDIKNTWNALTKMMED